MPDSENQKGGERGAEVIRGVLEASAPRPTVSESSGPKLQYAIRFADAMAKQIAKDLGSKLGGIAASTKRTAGAMAGKKKQLDVNFSTPEHGLVLGISLKSVHLRDALKKKGAIRPGRYTHNMKRNEEELRIEAGGYHRRQPYAVMIGVLFLPFDSCDDAIKDPSSFGSWVKHLRPFTRRLEPDDDADRFEKLYVALYEADGTDLRFFDVESDPPKKGRPPKTGDLRGPDGRARRLLSYGEFLKSCYEMYVKRNSVDFQWASGEKSPLDLLGYDSDDQIDADEAGT